VRAEDGGADVIDHRSGRWAVIVGTRVSAIAEASACRIVMRAVYRVLKLVLAAVTGVSVVTRGVL
jgi:hypothetical protein